MNFNFLQARSLKTRVTFSTLAIFLVSICLLLFYGTAVLHEDMEKLLGEQQFASVSFMADEINQEMEDRLVALEKTAAAISPAMMASNSAMQSFLEKNQVVVSMFNSGVYVTRLDGVAIADFPMVKGRTGTDYLDREWVAAALKGKSSIGKPVMGKTLHAPVIVMATPVRDPKGVVAGVLMGAINLSKTNFINSVATARYGKTGGYLLIAPQHNLFVTATDKSRIMKPLPSPGVNPMHDRYMQGFDGFGVAVSSRGIEELSAAKHIPATGWFLVAVMPTKEAFAPAHKMKNRIMLTAIFLSLLVGVLTRWMLKRQLAPMLDAAETLASFSNSDQPLQPLPIVRDDEVGQLIGGFNGLLVSLSQREKSLLEVKGILETQNVKLQLSEEYCKNNSLLLQNVLENFPGVVFWKDVNSVYLGCNRAFSEAGGLRHPDDIVGKTDYDLPWAETEASHYRNIDRHVIDGGEAELHLIETQHQVDGRTVWFDTCKVPIRDNDGAIVGVLGTSFDITETKRAEEEKIKLQSQLHQAQKIESVGRLAGGVAHDFNNMLSVILGYAEMSLMRIDQSHPMYASLSEIYKAAGRSADLTRQLLAFARKQTVAPRVINLNETVAGMLSMLQRLIGENMHLTWQPGANLWPVMMDCSQIDQILANLCVNARDAIVDIGKIAIETENCVIDENYCRIIPYASPGDYIKIVVSDNGTGMDRETLDHIFEPFFTTKEAGVGTGLGLATVYGIVRQNNGFITVDSETGIGTTFTIYLPRYEGASDKSKTEDATEILPRGNETILLVEDEPAILEMATMILEDLGYSVLQSAAPGEAIRLAREHAGEIHLVITDVIMPEMNGKELANRLLSFNPQIKCLFMSGYTADIIAPHGVLDEGVHFIHKPFNLADMATKVREVLDGSNQG